MGYLIQNKRAFLIIFILFQVYGAVFAQNSTSPKSLSSPLNFREVRGIVKDSTNNAIIGANITLISPKDTLKGQTNSNGEFIFEKVKSAVFVMTISQLGFVTAIKKYFNNDEKETILLDPIVLASQSFLLKEVSINGKPSIIYKTDTVEYKAADYKVREYANVDEMLKKMEGMEVASNGTLTYQGQQVAKAKLNGKSFAGGDVAQAIKNLPADIVDKIQIIDEYGDQADRTGIKDGDPIKVLNITTRLDRSIGDLVRINSGAGNENRYNLDFIGQHINANEELGIIGSLNNTQNGIAPNNSSTNSIGAPQSGGNSNSSGGTINTSGSSFYYRDQWGKQIQFNASYTYSDLSVSSINNSTIQQFSTIGTNNIVNESNGNNNTKKHTVNLEFEYAINNNDFLRIVPTFSYSTAHNTLTSQQLFTGLMHQLQNNSTQFSNTIPNLEGIVLFQHKFENNALRNFTVQLDFSKYDNEQDNNNDKDIQYYKDATQAILKDSLQDYFLAKNNQTKDYKAVITYIEPAGYLAQIEFITRFDYKKYNNIATVDSINLAGISTRLFDLTNNYQYSFTNTRIGIDYSADKIRYNFRIGAAIIPYALNGVQISLNNTIVRKLNINIVPIFRFQYTWSNTQKLTISYSGQPLEPSYDQLQPFVDKSDPQNIIVGNPNLSTSFYNTASATYNNYITNSKLNLTARIYTSVYSNQIVTNTLQIFQPALNTYINEIHYLNKGEKQTIGGNYNVAKQIDDRKYIISLLGRIIYTNYTTMSNNIPSFNKSWLFNERLGVRMNPNDRIEINPYISYNINRTFFSINETNTNIKTTVLAIDGKVYFLNTWLVGYSANKNFINGISYDISRNPLVINTYLEKEFLKRKNLILNLQVFDILHQNNYINQIITPNSITDIKTNALSRYIMLSLRFNLQKWNGTPTKNGVIMSRRGDGSFIY